jgi:hypothetical protein
LFEMPWVVFRGGTSTVCSRLSNARRTPVQPQY